MHVPQSMRKKIRSQVRTNVNRKAKLFSVYVMKHPEPTWQDVSDVLYRCNEGDEDCHTTLDIVQSKYPTGKCLSFSVSILIHFLPPSPLPPVPTLLLPSCAQLTLFPSPPSPLPPPLPVSLTPFHSVVHVNYYFPCCTYAPFKMELDTLHMHVCTCTYICFHGRRPGLYPFGIGAFQLPTISTA